jgi:hypothetical protein
VEVAVGPVHVDGLAVGLGEFGDDDVGVVLAVQLYLVSGLVFRHRVFTDRWYVGRGKTGAPCVPGSENRGKEQTNRIRERGTGG